MIIAYPAYIRNYANNYSYLANNWHIYKCAGVVKVLSQEHFLNLIVFAEFSLIIFSPYDLNCATFKIEKWRKGAFLETEKIRYSKAARTGGGRQRV